MKPHADEHTRMVGSLNAVPKSGGKRLGNRGNDRPWHVRKLRKAVIRLKELKDGQWYRGVGRNNNFGRWDAEARCFWVISFANFPDPERYPEGSTRIVRLKQEHYFTPLGGTFKPLAPL